MNTSGIDTMTQERAVELRMQYRTVEWTIRFLGTLYLLSFVSIPALIVGVGVLGTSEVGQHIAGSFGWTEIQAKSAYAALIICLGLLGALYGLLGVGLRRLQPKWRVPATILGLLGLIGGGMRIVQLIMVATLWSRKGTYVLSPEYKRVIAMTPGLEYRSWVLRALVLVMLLAVVSIGMVALFSPHGI